MGWNELREQIFANQKRLGVIPAEHAAHARGRTSCRNGTRFRLTKKKLFILVRQTFLPRTRLTPITKWCGPGAGGHRRNGQHADHLHRRRQRHERRGRLVGMYNEMTAYNGVDRDGREHFKFYDVVGPRQDLPAHGGRRGRGRSIRRSSGPSRWRRISAAPARAWSSPGPATSRTPAASARSSTT